MHLMHDYAVARIGRRHARWGHCACLLAFAVGPCTGTTYAADTTLTQWRMQALQVRALAENDAVEAYARAVKLQVLPAGATVEDQVSGLNLLARTELYLAMTEDAGSHAERALALATAQNDRLGQARADLVLALNTVNQGRIERLQEVVHQAVKVLDGFPQPALQAEATLRLAMLYNRLGQFEESVRVCVQSLQNAAASKNPEALAYAHHCMAISVGLGGNTSSARPHYEAMAQAARQSGSRLMLAQAITGQAAEIALREDHRRSEPLLREALHIYSQVGAPFFILYALSALAYNQSHQGRHADALRLRSEVIAGFERYPNRIALWWVLMGRAVDYIKLSNFSAALADTQRAYRIATDIGLYNYVSDSARQLGVLAAQRGDYQSAYAWAAQAEKLVAKAASEKLGRQVSELAERYELENKQRDIDALVLHNTRQQAELERERLQRRWLWSILACIGCLATCIMAFALRLRSSHRLIAELNSSLELQVTERTAELRRQKRYLRTLIDTLPFSVWFKDTSSRYLAVNRAYAKIQACEVDAVVGKDDQQLYHAMAITGAAEDSEVMASRQARSAETRHSVGDGQHVCWMETFTAPVVDEDDVVLGTVGFAFDISIRKQADHAREIALAEAQRLARLRSDFLAQMSHELRTPLNAILGYAQLLRGDAVLCKAHRTAANVMYTSGEHLLTMINDLLDSAKIDADKVELRLAPVTLRQSLLAVAEMVRVRAAQKALGFGCEIDDALPSIVLADEQRLRQALLNLLANAIKFTDQGQVSLRVRALPQQRVRFEVIDTGIGIDSDQLERIFLPFEQAGLPNRHQGGTGLGLSISRRFVRLMGGDIAVDSVPGCGCRFWFELELPELSADDEPPVRCNAPLPDRLALAPLVAPLAEEMAALRKLAELGNMHDVLLYATRLERLDMRHASFAAHVRRLAEGYESRALLQLVEQHGGAGRSD